jgi:ribosomal protein S20
MKKLIAGMTVAGLMVAGGATAAVAADSSPSGTQRTAASGRLAKAKHLAGGALKVAAQALGMEPKDLLTELRGGKTVADVAKEKGVALDTVEKAMVDAATKRIDEAVANGKLDPERAATMKSKLSERVDKLVNHKVPKRSAARRHAVRRHDRRGAVKLAAKTIGIEPKDLATGIRSGKTVAEVAKAHDVDPQKVIDAIVKAGDAKIDQAVKSGKLDGDRAAELKDRLGQRVTKLVNDTPHRKANQNANA